jgi:hypothetical protein
MVAAHGWDLMGAKRVGMTTASVSRREGLLLATLPAPDVAGEDLLSVANGILEHTWSCAGAAAAGAPLWPSWGRRRESDGPPHPRDLPLQSGR